MKRINPYLAATAIAGAFLCGSGSAQAATAFTWEYTASGSNAISGSGTSTQIANATTSVGSLTANVTGWSNTRTSASGSSSDGTSSARFDRQRLHGGAYNLSMYTSNSSASCSGTREVSGCTPGTSVPNHAIDNNGAQEFVLFVFSEAVVLNQLAIGWPDTEGYDTDMTVVAYTGDGVMPNLTTLSSADILAGDFYIEHLANVGKDSGTPEPYGAIKSFNAGGVASQYWLVGAYNHHLGGSLSANNDYVKLALLGGHIPEPPCEDCEVPEPMTLGLVGLGLLGLRRLRPRR